MPPLDPRRSSERIYFFDATITIKTNSGSKSKEELANLSMEGIGVISRAGYYPGDMVKMEIEVFGKKLTVDGQVRRVVGKETYIEFYRLSEEEENAIERLILEHGSTRKPDRFEKKKNPFER